ncbi:MAG: thiamine diphosphokinase, partial [Actinomycetota bacterium]
MSGQPSDKRVLVVTGGSVLRAAPALGPFDMVIAADSGVDSAFALGLAPDVVIGDLDSVSDAGLARVRAAGITVLSSPTDKDLTDTELAIAHAVEHGTTSLTILAGGGDRIDHVLGIVSAASHPSLAALERVNVRLGRDLMHIVHGGRAVSLALPIGTTLSLIPLAGHAHGVTTSGLRWPLRNETLHGSAARGVSNECSHPEVAVAV